MIRIDQPAELFKLPPGPGLYMQPGRPDWMENTVYEVLVSMRANNPVHKALFFSGFLQLRREGGSKRNAQPGGYNRFILPYQDSSFSDVYYMQVIRPVLTVGADHTYSYYERRL